MSAFTSSPKVLAGPSTPSPWARFVAERRRSLPVRKIAGLCRRYLSWYGNLSYDVCTNGERMVLQRLAAFRPSVLFDVGANVGDWSLAAGALIPGAEIHAFEVSPPTFDRLVANTKHLANVRCVRVGLSDRAGPVKIHHYSDVPSLSSCLVYPHPFTSTEIMGELTTGEAYAASQGIPNIDFLKIDVEGMEDNVLRGFDGLLRHRAIRLIQFEYGRVNIISRFLLRDFYELFASYGYSIGKIYPNYVDFRDYQLIDEDFMGPNYLACRQEDATLAAALGGISARSSAPAAPLIAPENAL